MNWYVVVLGVGQVSIVVTVDPKMVNVDVYRLSAPLMVPTCCIVLPDICSTALKAVGGAFTVTPFVYRVAFDKTYVPSTTVPPVAGGAVVCTIVKLTVGPSLTSVLHTGPGDAVSEEEHAWDRTIDAPTHATN